MQFVVKHRLIWHFIIFLSWMPIFINPFLIQSKWEIKKKNNECAWKQFYHEIASILLVGLGYILLNLQSNLIKIVRVRCVIFLYKKCQMNKLYVMLDWVN